MVKVGWSWSLFLSSGTFGVPLFYRGLAAWGYLFLMLSTVDVLVTIFVRDTASAFSDVLNFVSLALTIWIGMRGNEMTAKTLLNRGWEMMDPHSYAAQCADEKWNLSAWHVAAEAPGNNTL